jgi:hypothetical protein
MIADRSLLEAKLKVKMLVAKLDRRLDNFSTKIAIV